MIYDTVTLYKDGSELIVRDIDVEEFIAKGFSKEKPKPVVKTPVAPAKTATVKK